MMSTQHSRDGLLVSYTMQLTALSKRVMVPDVAGSSVNW